MKKQQQQQPVVDQWMRMKDVCKALGVERDTLYRWAENPAIAFPPHDALILNKRYWRASTIDAFRERMEASSKVTTKITQ